MSLITRERAARNLASATLSAAQGLTLDGIVAGVSAGIESYCRRQFLPRQYDELYNGYQQRRLLLRHYPVLSVARIAYNPIPVLTVTNTSSSNQRATVEVTDTGLILIRVASGTVTRVESVTWASYATLSLAAAAVTALGNGWSATVQDTSTYNNWPSADLRPLQGAANAKNVSAPLYLHSSELSDFQVDAATGWLLRGQAVNDAIFPETGIEWHGGVNYWRVIYTAGYDPVPEDIQEAAAEWAAEVYERTQRDPSVQAVSSAPVADTATSSTYAKLDTMPGHVRQLIVPYRTFNFASRG